MKRPKINKQIVGTLIFFFFSLGNGFAKKNMSNQYDFTQIDRHVLSTPKSVEHSINKLADYLNKAAHNETEQTRAIYQWITRNIVYDVDSFFRKTYLTERMLPEDTLLKGKGVCDAYAGIFAALGTRMGLKVEKVSGYAKGYGYIPGTSIKEPNHAWNAVQIDGTWHLLDATWGAGNINDKRKFEFSKGVEREFFFLTPPEAFLSGHFPSDSKWQLMASPISKQEFDKRVLLGPGFFALGLKTASHNEALIIAKDKVMVHFQKPDLVQLFAEIEKNGEKLDQMLVNVESDKGRVNVVFPAPGIYNLRIFANRKKEQRYELVTSYRIQAKKGTDFRYPILTAAFFDYGMRLDNQQNGVINVTDRTTVTFLSPKTVEIWAEIYQKGKKMGREISFIRPGTTSVLARFPKTGKYILQIFAKNDPQSTHYEMAAEYRVNVTKGTDQTFPAYSSDFFTYGLETKSHENGRIKTGKRLAVQLKMPSDFELYAQLHQKDKKLSSDLVFIEPGKNTVNAVFPKPGMYTLQIFSKRKKDQGDYHWVISYEVSAAQGTEFRFPHLGEGFFAHGLALDSHQSGVIKTGDQIAIHFTLQSDTQLLARLLRGEQTLPSNMTYVNAKKGMVQALFPEPGDYILRVFSKKGRKEGTYSWAIDYQIHARKGTKKRF